MLNYEYTFIKNDKISIFGNIKKFKKKSKNTLKFKTMDKFSKLWMTNGPFSKNIYMQ